MLFSVFLNRQDGSALIFFQDLSENTYSLQPALKSNAPSL